ncbi:MULTISPECIES: hypothetical protein [Prauserella]|uniref:Uncharacterized protein n=2 Tax=Prauserella TaxID=142577 RepID=A0A318LSJ8_9PSEU|nr:MULTISPECIES: hypothetical protein [Prauserella]PXY35045.1 hypothetical protein BAY59_06140 [Prauserella coralliicola]PXY37704.1 hypothetical protein BA062_03530 [Prauserella flavalba]RBM19162.1 hypothetical protein DI005_15775 [Prauserella sp. PE36]TKG73575.1 hypothetical protein FCN18_03195 [Prauserella endophytica]
MTCTHCQSGLDHCHGTLVQHVAGGAECTDQGCTDFELVRHTLVIECESVDGGCACTEPVYYEELLRAS